jgi:hypothetical protein
MKTVFARLTNPCLAPLMAVAGLVGMSGSFCQAQVVKQVTEGPTTVRETRVDGRLHLTGPDSVTITTANSDPTTYRYGNAIQYVDDAGLVLSREQIVPGTPVSVVTVAQPSGGVVTNRVIVHKATATTVAPATGAAVTTTTVTETTVKPTKAVGVLLEKEPDRVLVRTPKDGDLTFTYSRVTDFADSEGRHVDLIRFVPGLPVQVEFRQVGDRLEASRVLLQGRVKD